MIEKSYFHIKQGPSQWDVMLSFFEDKEIIFSLESQSRLFFGLSAVVSGIKRVPGSKFILYLSLECDFQGETLVYAYYNLQTRLGHITPFDNPLCNLPSPIERRELVLDFLLSSLDCIKKGNYDFVDEDFLSYQCWEYTDKKISFPVVLFRFDAPFSISTAREWMKRCNVRPASDRELLALGYQFPELQEWCHPILAIGDEQYNGLWSCLSINEALYLNRRELCLIEQMKILNGPYYIMAIGNESKAI